MTLPNALSVIRAVSVAPVVWLIALGDLSGALVLFLLAAATDLADGALARRKNLITPLGTFLDPLADKILVVGVLAALAFRGAAPLWAVGVIVARELIAVELRVRAHETVAAAFDGKLKTILQVAALATLLAAGAWPSAGLAAGASALLTAAVALTVLSGVMLVRRAA
ncbi:MAG TPA: CDP-alcohol phosphatidyltransferase family protein [Candidatus Limnocylindria bacterium]|nr:CDP-alcohol phosphatidyltransferase family protein [Candidatus Limnocylindria bacterium]